MTSFMISVVPPEVHGDIYQDWAGLGSENGRVGFPITNELPTPDRFRAFNAFQGGAIYWSPESGAAEIEGDIRARWAAIGWENSPLGFPTTDEVASTLPGGRGNRFEYGVIEWTPQMGALITSLVDYASAVDKQENRITFASAKQSFTYDNNDQFFRYTDPDPAVDPTRIDLNDFEAGLAPNKVLVVEEYLEDPAHESRFYLVDFPTGTSRAAGKTLLATSGRSLR